jgi:hypothetical protein
MPDVASYATHLDAEGLEADEGKVFDELADRMIESGEALASRAIGLE